MRAFIFSLLFLSFASLGAAEAWAQVKVRGAKRLAALMKEHRQRALDTRELATLVCDEPGMRAAS